METKNCLIFLIFCCFSLYQVEAQHSIWYNQNYTYKKTDGFVDENYSLPFHSQSGKVYTNSYKGVVTIIGNNYFREYPAINGFVKSYQLDSNTVISANVKNIFIFKADTLLKTIAFPNIVCFVFKDKHTIIIKNKSQYSVYQLKNDTLGFVKQLPFFDEGDGRQWAGIANNEFYYLNDSIYCKLSVPDLTLTQKQNLLKLDFNRTIQGHFVYLKNQNLIFDIENDTILKNYDLNDNFRNSANDHLITNAKPSFANSCINNGKNEFTVLDYQTLAPIALFNSSDIHKDAINLPGTLSYIVDAGIMPQRIFSYLKKYPNVFNPGDATNIFTLRQHSNGSIWAGSYKTGLTIIDRQKQIKVPVKDILFMNGGSCLNNNMYLVGEFQNGLIRVNENGSYCQLTKNITGFYTYISRDQKDFYFGTNDINSLYKKPVVELDNPNIPWKKIDSTKGVSIRNILCITEDTLGRIWCGHPKNGIAVYNPMKDTAKTYLLKNGETTFGAYCNITDQYGTVWMGCIDKQGIWYYDDYTLAPTPANCKQVIHPLLEGSKLITALTIFRNWLVIAAGNKILLLDIDALRFQHKTIVRYLSAQETNFTAGTEQNTMLTSFVDSTIWFSTTDMLYQWDIKKWLSLPSYKVQLKGIIKIDSSTVELSSRKPYYLDPTQNSFELAFEYQSPDLLPRYSSICFIKNGDTVKLPEPNLQSQINLKNLRSGKYNFIVEIYEQDGSISRYQYTIVIEKFIWQQWWFWLGIFAAIGTIILYLVNEKRKRQIAIQMAKTKEAELLAYKAEQEKKLANLQLVTLSSQFRPHFILNALNTIGAQMDDKPNAESILSRLGESINIIFTHAQFQKTLHSLQNEWTLVLNIIQIHRMMYLKSLETSLPGAVENATFKDLQLPMGLLQIPVENALLHGLSNREIGPWILNIQFKKEEDNLLVVIEDNGIGRLRSAKLSNFTKHGTGTKNLNEILSIINTTNENKITLKYDDEIFSENDKKYGTRVTIKIPRQLHYET